MASNQVNVPKKKLFTCCRLWIIFFAALLFCYFYLAANFYRKVWIFKNKIEVGMSEFEVLGAMGKFSQFEQVNGVQFKLIYQGQLFLSPDLVLIFNSSTGKLTEKSRGFRLITD